MLSNVHVFLCRDLPACLGKQSAGQTAAMASLEEEAFACHSEETVPE